RISIEVRPVYVIRAAIIATCPTRIGPRNETWSIDAVTASERQCRCATTAAARSIQWRTIPPSTFPSVFASFGSTSWTMSTRDSRGGFPARLRERGVDVLHQRGRLRVRALLREVDGLLDLPLDFLERLLLVRLVDDAALHQHSLEP